MTAFINSGIQKIQNFRNDLSQHFQKNRKNYIIAALAATAIAFTAVAVSFKEEPIFVRHRGARSFELEERPEHPGLHYLASFIERHVS